MLAWDPNTPKAQRIWFVIYDPKQERRLRKKFGEFDLASKRTGHPWIELSTEGLFSEWMTLEDYREAYFERGELTGPLLENFQRFVADRIREFLLQPAVDDNTIAAIHGVASLFGFLRVSDLLDIVQISIRGRLVVFFPGVVQGTTYRLLDARDGWNYHAVPITI